MKGYWCIPKKQDADFVACMEDIIDVYERPYARKRPVVCLDENPCSSSAKSVSRFLCALVLSRRLVQSTSAMEPAAFLPL